MFQGIYPFISTFRFNEYFILAENEYYSLSILKGIDMSAVNLELVKSGSLEIIDLEIINVLIAQGGPTANDIPKIRLMADYLSTASVKAQLDFHEKLKPILIRDTLLGWTFLKPHGYAGDFELIDRIHTGYVTDNPEFKNWDLMYHNLSACVALRNRKEYFNSLVDSLIEDKGFVTVLNLGSGPARDIKEFLDQRPNAPVMIDCVDMDLNSITYAKELCKDHHSKVRFFEKNVLKLRVEDQYDLVWSAGMFDYFSDKLFSRLVKKYFDFVKVGGQMVLGNISTSNEDKTAMEVFGQWILHHRSEQDLTNLVNLSGIHYTYTNVLSEPTGVNIFTHTYK